LEAVLSDLFNIFTHIVFPVLLIVASGYFTEKKFRFELTALTKMLFYVITPCLVFTRIYETSPSWQTYGLFPFFTLVMIVSMGIVGLLFSRLRHYPPSLNAAFLLTVMMCNSGNYGLPVIELMFSGNAYASSIQLIVMTTQGMINYTFGIFLLSRGHASFKESVKNTFRYPLIYTVVIVFIFSGLDIPVWRPVWVTMEMISRAFVPIALFTLGAQLGRIRIGRGITNVFISAGLRLLLAPCIGFFIIKLFGLSGMPAQVLFVGTSMPSAVNTALLAVELKNESEFASQAVLFSTLVSFFTVSLAIWVARTWIG
jgi:predicted permease